MRRFLLTLLLLGLAVPAGAQLGSPAYTFTPNTTIVSSEVNSLFSTIYTNALNRTGGTMTGTLTTQGIVPSTHDTYDLGVTGTRFQDLWLEGNIDADGTLNVEGAVTLQSTLALTGAATLSSTLSAGATTVTTLNTGQGAYELYAMNQDVESTDAVTFASVDTGQGANELYGMDQAVLTTSTVQFARVVSAPSGLDAASIWNMSGTLTPSSGNAFGMFIGPTITGAASGALELARISGTLVEAGSGTHALVAGLRLVAPTVTDNAGTATNAATLYINDAPSTTVSGALYSLWVDAGAVAFDEGFRERGRTYDAGERQTISYDAGNFVGSASMTWTVQSGDLINASYSILGDTATVNYTIQTSSVGGTNSTALLITMPVTAAERVDTACLAGNNSTTLDASWCFVGASSNVLNIYLRGGGTWTTSTNNTAVYVQISFKVS